MLKDVLIFLEIPRSANNLGSKAKSERNNQSILENSTIFEDEYIYCPLETDSLTWIDLTASSTSFFFFSFSFFISKNLYWKTIIRQPT